MERQTFVYSAKPCNSYREQFGNNFQIFKYMYSLTQESHLGNLPYRYDLYVQGYVLENSLEQQKIGNIHGSIKEITNP